MAKNIKLSIIIVNFNTKDLLEGCLKSLSTSNLKFEVIVVDNGSSDNSVEFVRKFKVQNSKFKIILIENRDNLGFAKANNQGIDIAQGEYIMLLNSDTVVKNAALKILVDYLDKLPKVAGVSPQLLNEDGSKQIDYYMNFPNLWQIVFYHNYPLRLIAMNSPIRYLFTRANKVRPFNVDQLPGAALMTRKKIINDLGTLDEDFNFFFEDVDWCYRIKNTSDKKLQIVPQAEITHYGGASWKKWLKENRLGFYSQYYLSLLNFVEKNYNAPIFFYQLGLTFSFLINLIFHLILLSPKKARIQAELIATMWSREFDFHLPE